MEEINKIIVALAEQVSFRLRKHNLVANTVAVVLKTNNFNTFTHQKSIEATSRTKDILLNAKNVLEEMYKENYSIRLVGVRVDNLESKDIVQLSLFNNNQKQDKIDYVLDNLKSKYGYNSITRAGQLDIKSIVDGKEKKMKEG